MEWEGEEDDDVEYERDREIAKRRRGRKHVNMKYNLKIPYLLTYISKALERGIRELATTGSGK